MGANYAHAADACTRARLCPCTGCPNCFLCPHGELWRNGELGDDPHRQGPYRKSPHQGLPPDQEPSLQEHEVRQNDEKDLLLMSFLARLSAVLMRHAQLIAETSLAAQTPRGFLCPSPSPPGPVRQRPLP